MLANDLFEKVKPNRVIVARIKAGMDLSRGDTVNGSLTGGGGIRVFGRKSNGFSDQGNALETGAFTEELTVKLVVSVGRNNH